MLIENTLIRRLYRIALCIECSVGICVHVAGSTNGMMLFWYFTVLSNILVLGYFIFLVGRDFSEGERYSEPMSSKGAVTMCIVLTGLVFNIMLAPSMASGNGIPLPGNTYVHIITPIMVFLDYVLFSPKGRFTKRDPLLWAILPIVYLVAIYSRAAIAGTPMSTRGETASLYPYPFLDVDMMGAGQVAINLIAMSVVYIAAGYALVALDHALAKKKPR